MIFGATISAGSLAEGGPGHLHEVGSCCVPSVLWFDGDGPDAGTRVAFCIVVLHLGAPSYTMLYLGGSARFGERMHLPTPSTRRWKSKAAGARPPQ